MATLAKPIHPRMHGAAEFLKSPSLNRLLEIGTSRDPFSKPAGEIGALQLQAAREVVAIQKGRIKIVGRRIEESGTSDISSAKDLLPLLFAHTVYKSYPVALLKRGQWDKLLK